VSKHIPIGWERRELGEIATFTSGGTPSRSVAKYWGDEVPWVSAKDLKSFDLADSIERLTREGADRLNLVPKGTILILVRGMGLFKDIPVGIASREMAFNQDVKALRLLSDVDARFLGHTLVSMRAAIMGKVDTAGHGTGRLSTDYLIALPIRLPPLQEQHRIVAVLDAWDQAIAETERLIEAKRKRKAGQLQHLFDGLPKRPLLEAADVRFSGVDKKSNDGEKPVRLCNYMDVFHNSRITSELKFMAATANANEIAANSLRIGDVVFTKDSETAEEIAEPALVAEDIENLVCGYHLAIARPKDGVAHGPFLAQAMRHSAIRWQFRRLANGVVRFGLTLDAIEQAEIFLPPFAVQEKIADALDDGDISIEELLNLAAKFRAQKRGLMQKLLTGDWRLDARFDREPLASPRRVLAGAVT